MKKNMLICGPLTSRSGYGDHARDLFHSFYDLNQFEIKVLDVNWGQCPRNALNPKDSKDKLIWDRILVEPKVDQQPDVYIDIRIPNEFETFGKFNIGITAGIETDIISTDWIEGCNKMDLLIVPSNHSKKGLVDTIYDKINTQPDGSQQKIGALQITKPVEVLFEGLDEVFKNKSIEEIEHHQIFKDIQNNIKEEFAFLTVGLWGNGDYGEDRKDIARTIKVFCEAFANKKKKPALILKTNGAGFSILDKQSMHERINKIKDLFPNNFELPNIYLLHGDLTKEEMNGLYNHPKVKCLVSFSHGEGFGRPLLEASATGLPIMASGWSGQLDFLDPNTTLLLKGELKQVPKSQVWDKIIVPESKWFNVNEDKAYDAFISIVDDYYTAKRKARSQADKNVDKFSLNKMTQELKVILDKYVPKTQYTQLKLPKLKKTKQTGIKLPKLKKV